MEDLYDHNVSNQVLNGILEKTIIQMNFTSINAESVFYSQQKYSINNGFKIKTIDPIYF